MRLTPIGDLVARVGTWNPKTDGDGKFSYIDIGSVDRQNKTISNVAQVDYGDAPSRARQLVACDDVLVATVRPNLNAVAIVPGWLNGATASTGFCVLRPTSKILSSYLFHWVRSPQFVADMVKKSTGQSYPAVSDKVIRGARIPVPSTIEEQGRIVEALNRADELRVKRRQAIDLLNELAQSTFLRMFGSSLSDWPDVPVEELAAEGSAAIRTGPFGSQLLHSEFVEDGIPVLGIDNVVNNEFRWNRERFIVEDKYTKLSRYRVLPGDVLISIMGTCGRCAIAPDDIPIAINTKHLCCITLDKNKCFPEYLHSYFLMHPTARAYLHRTAKGAIMSGLNMGIIKALPVKLPPMAEQARYVEIVQTLKAQKGRNVQQMTELDDLFASLQQRAFRGEL